MLPSQEWRQRVEETCEMLYRFTLRSRCNVLYYWVVVVALVIHHRENLLYVELAHALLLIQRHGNLFLNLEEGYPKSKPNKLNSKQILKIRLIHYHYYLLLEENPV